MRRAAEARSESVRLARLADSDPMRRAELTHRSRSAATDAAFLQHQAQRQQRRAERRRVARKRTVRRGVRASLAAAGRGLRDMAAKAIKFGFDMNDPEAMARRAGVAPAGSEGVSGRAGAGTERAVRRAMRRRSRGAGSPDPGRTLGRAAAAERTAERIEAAARSGRMPL